MVQLCRNSFAKKIKFLTLIGIAAATYQQAWPFCPQHNFDWLFNIVLKKLENFCSHKNYECPGFFTLLVRIWRTCIRVNLFKELIVQDK